MAQTLVEKIATRYADRLDPGQLVRSGDFITIRPKHVMTHDNTGAVIPKFRQIGATKIHDPRQPVFAIDHDIQNVTPENLGKYAKIDAFAREHGIDFYPAGTGISHQVMVEQGYVVPGSLVVGSDSHSNLYGAAAALGTPVVRTDAASIWATGVTWWQVPPVARATLKNKLQPGVVGKDVIIALCGLFNKDEVLNHAVEFHGEGVASMTMDQRLSIANMTTEWGALAGVFPFDDVLRDYLFERAAYFAKGIRPGRRGPQSLGMYTRADVERWWAERLLTDEDASYAIELELDLATVIPNVSGPNDVKTMTSLPEIEQKKVKINKAWLMSCVNARYEDIAEAARIVKGRRVAEGVEFYLAAASADVQAKAQREGHWQALLEAGAIELPPGCGTCIGLGRGTIKAGEVGISATNRNFEGRMGDRNGLVYLGSPAVVAASAINGYISAPVRFEPTRARIEVRTAAKPQAAAEGVKIIDGFPEVVNGRAMFMNRDNLNTDGIYAGKWTYKDDMKPEEMAAVIFENYDPNFKSIANRGDIIVGGKNFGTGSSREQAATALKYFGIPCVIAASFSETYKRNAFNNGFVVFECPQFVEYLKTKFAGAKEKTAVGPEIEVNYRQSKIVCDGKAFPFPPLSPVAQELVVVGGAEAVVQKRLQERATLMTILNQLACALNRRDEAPNQQLAERVVKQRDTRAVRELVGQLSVAKKAVRSDCIKVLYEIGEREPKLIADYCDEFAALIDSKDNRLAWGAMTALDCIAAVRPNDVYKLLDQIVEAANTGSVITRDHAVGILIKLAANKAQSKKAIGMLLQILKDAPGNQIPMYAENAYAAIGTADREAFTKILARRMDGLEKESQKKRVAKVLRKLERT